MKTYIFHEKKFLKLGTTVVKVFKDKIEIGLAIKSKKDMFNKKKGVKVARERLEKNPIIIPINKKINIRELRMLTYGLLSTFSNRKQFLYKIQIREK